MPPSANLQRLQQLSLLSPEQRESVLSYFSGLQNASTRDTYGRAMARFLEWARAAGFPALEALGPQHVGAYAEDLGASFSPMSVRMHLIALRRVFEWLVVAKVLSTNPTRAVPNPNVAATDANPTQALDPALAVKLLSSIRGSTFADIRDRALITVLMFADVPVTSFITLLRRDYIRTADEAWFRIHLKRGRIMHVHASSAVAAAMDEYLAILGPYDLDGPLFVAVPNGQGINRVTVNFALSGRARKAGIKEKVTPQIIRVTGRGALPNAPIRVEANTQLALDLG